jgi:hypothetical protein
MNTLAAIVFLGLFVALIAGGVIVNLYLYSRGAFRGGSLRRTSALRMVTLSQEAVAENDYYLSIGRTSNGADIRGTLFFVFAVIVALSLIIAFVLSIVAH